MRYDYVKEKGDKSDEKKDFWNIMYDAVTIRMWR